MPKIFESNLNNSDLQTVLLDSIEHQTRVGSWVLNLHTFELYASSNFFKLLGLNKKKGAFSFEQLNKIVAENDKPKFTNWLQTLTLQKETEVSFSILHSLKENIQSFRLTASGFKESEEQITAFGFLQEISSTHSEAIDNSDGQEVREKQQLLAATMDSSMDMIQVFKAVRDNNNAIIDFIWILNNHAAEKIYGDVIGKSLLKENPGVLETGIFDTFKRVVETGIPDQSERHYVHEQFNGWFLQSTVKLGDGVATTTQDITSRKKAEEDILLLKDKLAKKVSDIYHTLFNSIDEGFSLLELIFDAEGHVIDCWHREDNEAFTRMTGIENPVNKKMSELLPNLEPEWYRALEKVYCTGESARIVYPVRQLGQWYSCYLSKIEDETTPLIVAVYSDITEQKKREERQNFLLKLNDSLRSIADPIAIEEAVTQTAMEYFGADRCYYCMIENDVALIRRDAATQGLPSVAGSYPLSSFPIFKKVVDEGKPFIVHDAHISEVLDESLRELCLQLQVISFINVPVIKDGTPVGILCLVQSAPRQWTETETAMAIETAERTWAAVERANAEKAMQLSEEKYRTLFDSMDEGYCIIQMMYDENGNANDWRFLQVNRAFELNNGLRNAEGKTIREMAPNIEDKWFTIYDRVAKTGHSVRFEEDSDALRRIFSLYAFRIGDASERKVAVIFTDITARKSAEVALRNSEERYRNELQSEIEKRTAEVKQQSILIEKITTTVPDMISVINLPTKTIRFINDDEFKTHGFDPEMMHKTTTGNLRFLIHPDDGHILDRYYEEMSRAAEDAVITAEYRARGTDDSPWKWFNVRGKVFTRNEKGGVEDILNVIQNVTESKEAREKLNALNEALAVKNRELESLASELKTFTSVAASDYKEPLQNVYTALEFIISGEAKNLSNAGRANLRRAQSTLQKLNLLTDDIIAFANIRKEEKSFTKVNLNAVAKLVLYDMRMAVANAAAQIEIKPLPTLSADALQMHLLFNHLLSNAIKFRKQDEILTVLIESEIGKKEVNHKLCRFHIVRFTDNGIGFEQKDADRIFNIFVKLEEKKYKGSGTGLAICKKIMEQHGGFITAASSLTDGTMLKCWFPIPENEEE